MHRFEECVHPLDKIRAVDPVSKIAMHHQPLRIGRRDQPIQRQSSRIRHEDPSPQHRASPIRDQDPPIQHQTSPIQRQGSGIQRRVRPIREPLLVLALLLAGCSGVPREASDIRHVRPDQAASAAIVVGESALVHTDQMFPVDASGRVQIQDDSGEQVRRTIDHLRIALRQAGTDLDDLAKLNVYLADDSLREAVELRLAEELPAGARPAVTYVTTAMEHPDVLVAMDAVAAVPDRRESLSLYRSEELFGPAGQAHSSTLPAGPKVYVSGQAEQGDLLEAVARTMEGLQATLAYVGLSARDVVQVKAFISSMSEASAVEETIGEYFRTKPAPPIVTTEWRQDAYPAEIEVVASGRRRDVTSSSDAVSFVTPPWMSSSPLFSRVTEVSSGTLIFVSGLYGTPGEPDAAQVEQMFDQLVEVLREAGSDVEHLVKATYYYTSEEAGNAINDVRTGLYNPDRPPAASKIAVRGVGLTGAAVTMDMISVVPK